MLTMFEMTFGNWYTPSRVLVEHCSEWFMIFFICHVMVIGFSMLAVINGVFINETFKVSERDDKYMLMRQLTDDKVHSDKMRRLFAAADVDGSGDISAEEFGGICTIPEIRNWLSAMQVDFDHTEELLDLVDKNGDGNVTVDELIEGMARLKGQAKAFDQIIVRKKIQRMEERISDRLTALERQVRTAVLKSSSSHSPIGSLSMPVSCLHA